MIISQKTKSESELLSEIYFMTPYGIQHDDILQIWESASSFIIGNLNRLHESISGMFRKLKKEISALELG